ncbi:hypothetical protein [Haloplanus halophilus]|uniref:hypothetical protein n=1 Tax=Haloplanus halophilus TaxID=2949993 RepID=UPI00203D0EBF|nr:hypothetical protein [Haloplanus sp. GDY1]
MSLRRDLRHGRRIARAEFVRSVRGYARDARRTLGLALAVLFFGAQLLFTLPTAYALGGTVRTAAAVPYLGPAGLLLPLGLLSLAALRTMERLGGVDAEALLLTTVHPRAVVVGLILAEVGRLTLWFGVPLVAVLGAFALGLGSPTLLPTAGLVLLPMLLCTAVCGYAVGITALRILRRAPTLRRLLKGGGIVALVGVVVLSQVVARWLVEGTLSLAAVLDALSVPVLTDYLALAFVGTPVGGGVPPAALAVLGGWLGLTPVGLAAAERSADALWFGDDTSRSEEESTTVTADGLVPPRPFAWTRAGRIAWGHLLRAVRHPQDLSHLLMLLFVAGPALGSAVGGGESGRLPLLAAGTGTAVGVYLSGATFGLNPLGDDRPHLPLLLLAETPPRTHLRGRAAAGLAVGLPVATLVPLGTVPLGTPPAVGLGFAALGVGLSVVAAGFALGLGCAYPIYESRELWGAETVAPSTLVLLCYSFVVLGGTATWLVLGWLTLSGGLAPSVLLAGALAVLGTLSVGTAAASYRYARRRYRRYVL